jgi:hypothetical protein
VWCKTGIATDPEWGVAYCAECGARYGAGMVNFPADATEIDRILCQRPERETQNWEPGETLDDLIIENEKRGVM